MPRLPWLLATLWGLLVAWTFGVITGVWAAASTIRGPEILADLDDEEAE